MKYFLLLALQTYGSLYLQEALPSQYQTLKGTEITLTPLGCTNMLVYMSLHLAQPTALPALNLGVNLQCSRKSSLVTLLFEGQFGASDKLLHELSVIFL